MSFPNRRLCATFVIMEELTEFSMADNSNRGGFPRTARVLDRSEMLYSSSR